MNASVTEKEKQKEKQKQKQKKKKKKKKKKKEKEKEKEKREDDRFGRISLCLFIKNRIKISKNTNIQKVQTSKHLNNQKSKKPKKSKKSDKRAMLDSFFHTFTSYINRLRLLTCLARYFSYCRLMLAITRYS